VSGSWRSWRLGGSFKDFDRHPSDVDRYNATARDIAESLGVTVNDLHGTIDSAGVERCLSDDGVHMSETGNERLADAVSTCIREALRR